MNIEKTQNGKELVIMPCGRLDTVTAPLLESEINGSISGTEKLVLDFCKLEYISSAGLRVLLTTQKLMTKIGSMVIRNVNENVREVLDITGFSDILTLE